MNARTESITTISSVWRKSYVSSDVGRDSIVFLSHMVTTKAKVDGMLNAKKDCLASCERRFNGTIRRRDRKKPTNSRNRTFEGLEQIYERDEKNSD